MDELIEDILTECQDVETRVPWPQRPFTDLDSQAHSPVRLPAEEGWVDILNDAKDEFEVDGATAVFSTWRVEAEDPLDIGDIARRKCNFLRRLMSSDNLACQLCLNYASADYLYWSHVMDDLI